jgi:flagellar biosynthesis component FlhA
LQERGRQCAISVSSEHREVFSEQMRAAGIETPVVADAEMQGQPRVEIFATIGTPGSPLQVHKSAA